MKSIIFNISEINKVNFTEVTQTLQTLTYTKTCVIIERKTYVTWTSLLPPSFISTMTTAEGPYTQSELLSIISGPNWLVLV